jgi:gliding motility-associated-like protein
MLASTMASADHITGGQMYYKVSDDGAGLFRYDVTWMLYMRCNSGRTFINPNLVAVYNKRTGAKITDTTISLSETKRIELNNSNPCISNAPEVCYDVGFYNFSLLLPPSPDGYVIVGQVVFRINSIRNFSPGYSNIGATYTAEIPGTNVAPNGHLNNSAQFTGNDLVIVCANEPFTYSFAATDKDGDELSYTFCEAYRQATETTGITAAIPGPPPYNHVPYGNGFSGEFPLGGNVKIDPKTGIITGIAPASGIYVVTVCVNEIRNNRVIATQRKELQINVAACTITAARLPAEIQLCQNTTSITFTNQSTSALIGSYSWELANRSGQTIFSSVAPTPQFNFADTGLYRMKLAINRGQTCPDSATTLIRVYPGFKPDFTANGNCLQRPTIFADATTTRYGTVNGWYWDFGELTTRADTSRLQNPSYTYPSPGSRQIVLTAYNSNGCTDTVSQFVTINPGQPIAMAYRDTLICLNDTLRLRASGTGNFDWKPAALGTNSPTPLVQPLTTTTYTVTLENDGCISTDSVRVRVTDQVNLQLQRDTTICLGDSTIVRASGNATRYAWQPATWFNNNGLASPTVLVRGSGRLFVSATIGNCSATDSISVTAIPYPIAEAGNDTTICSGSRIQLNGQSDGYSVKWSPATGLLGNGIINPAVQPPTTITYTLTALDNRGCPKPAFDSVTITVLPRVRAFAGRDTSIVLGQPLQLAATGGLRYQWIPATGLSDANIANPVANHTNPADRIQYKVMVYNEAGCADSAYVNVRIFNGAPTVYVPTAFTPNADGKNDVLRPILAGIQELGQFAIFNRLGQMVFTTSQQGFGWDGRLNGVLQPNGAFVWMVKALDYKGNHIVKKGTAVLIR